MKAMKSLKGFILQGQVLALYRDFMKISMRSGNFQVYEELRCEVRKEFESARNYESETHIEYNLALGKQKLKNFKSAFPF